MKKRTSDRMSSVLMRRGCGLALLLLSLPLPVFSGEKTPPERETAGQQRPRLFLWPQGAPLAKGSADHDRPSLTVYQPPAEKRNGCAVVVCPGGGYGHLAVGHEGRDIGNWFNTLGVTAFVLRYRHAPHYRHPVPLLDVQRALRLVRYRAKEWQVDPQRIGVMGFSAGGHLASSAGTHFDGGKKDAADPVDRVSCRPDFQILVYPVITLTDPYTHKGSRRNLLGQQPSAELIRLMSNEQQVTPQTPPAFLMHTSTDKAVPAENSVLFYLALRKAGVAAELHIYERGRHGYGLAPNDPVLSSWPDRLKDWMKLHGFLRSR